jgi:DivIVA domain-containing protein
MKVSAADLEKVRFPEGKRGYDAERVDAVLTEIVATLKEYEAAEEALHRTFVEAQRIKDDMVGEASAEAEKVRAEGNDFLARAKAEADQMTADATAASDDLLAAARASAEDLRVGSERLLEDKQAEAEAEAARTRSEAQVDSDRIISEATQEAGQALSSAKTEAAEMVREARAEQTELSKKVPQLRTAVNDIESHLLRLAEGGLAEVEVARGMIDLAAEEAAIEEVAPVETATEAAPPLDDLPAAAAEAPADAKDEPQPVAATISESDSEDDGSAPLPDSPSLRAPQTTASTPGSDADRKDSFYGGGLRRRMGERSKKKS